MRREVEEEGTVPSGPECCMCGDYGLSSHIFKCTVCRFRFQHKYCSNLYPEADSYNTCNWCLVRPHKKAGEEKSSPSCSSSSSSKKSSSDIDHQKYDCSKTIKKRKRLLLLTDSDDEDHDDNNNNNINNNKGGPNDVKQMMGRGCIAAQRVTNDGENAKRIIIKKVFRNKVRRYKLLEEVSS